MTYNLYFLIFSQQSTVRNDSYYNTVVHDLQIMNNIKRVQTMNYPRYRHVIIRFSVFHFRHGLFIYDSERAGM